MAFDVVKDVVSELFTSFVGSYLGFASERNSNMNVVEMFLNSVRKHTIQKKMGC